MIEVKNLVKKYGDHLAVDDISFKIEKGHIYGLLGPNGAGKSTTMNILTGYIASSEGEVIIDGYNIFDEPAKAKQSVGYLPEQPPVYMDLTPKEYLRFAAELKGISKKDISSMIEEVMNLTKIKDVENRLIKNLSKGYRQRVGLAQAILGYPEVIILDEPTVGLDPKQIIEIRELIKELGKKHTVILSSHILSEVSEICDYIMIISRGKLVASDYTKNLGNMKEEFQKINLTVKCSKDETERIVKPITQNFSVRESGEDGYTDISIESKKDMREALFFAFADEKYPIVKMDSLKVSLEDVFLELTEENDASEKESEETGEDKEEKDSESDI